MEGYIDLHCHPIPGIDDGVRTGEEGAALLAGLKRIGFDRVVATPHIRSGIWNNRADTVAVARTELDGPMNRLRADGVSLPQLDVAAEHMFDDVTWDLFSRGEAMPYPGGKSALIEFAYDSIPLHVEVRLWRLKKLGITPILAHPERYVPLYRDSDRLEALIGAGVKPLLDVMSLVGAYGKQPQNAAFRILTEGHYAAACSDSHKPSDVETVGAGLAALKDAVGVESFRRLLVDAPNQILAGRTI